MIALLPNFGAEEGDEGAIAHRPDLRRAALAWRELFPSDTQVIGLDDPPPRRFGGGPAWPWLPGEGGLPWLATERAVRRLRRLGFAPTGPDPATVRRVHDKAFGLRAAQDAGVCPLGDSLQIFEPDELDRLPAIVQALAPGPWVIKPRHGSSGRGRIPVQGGKVPTLGGALERLRTRGGAVLEPWLQRVIDLSVQLHLGDRVELLGSTRQLLSPSGVYLGNLCSLGGELPRAGTRWDDELEQAALRIGEAARTAGFRGACGIDAFVYRDEAGAEVLRPVVELNARHTLGTVALGILRRLEQEGLVDEAGGYHFRLQGESLEEGRIVRLPGGAAAALLEQLPAPI